MNGPVEAANLLAVHPLSLDSLPQALELMVIDTSFQKAVWQSVTRPNPNTPTSGNLS